MSDEVAMAAATEEAIDLSDLESSYDSAEAPESNFTEVPNGRYQAKVEKAYLGLSQSGKRMLKWQFRIISGQYANRMLFKNNMLETPENMGYLKADLERCGVTLGSIKELPARLGDLLDVCVEVNVKKVGENPANVYIDKQIAVDLPAGFGGGSPASVEGVF